MAKKNVLKKLFTICLSAFLCFSAFGCENKGASAAGDDNTSSEVLVEQHGTHTASVKPTRFYMVKNGQTDYKLLLPNEPTEYEIEAASLINEFMLQSLNVVFPVVYSNEVSDASSGKYISIGDTSLMRKSGISVGAEEYGSSGFKIVTKSDDVYISGARNTLRQGTYYGAQEFLKQTIGWKAYAADEVQFNVLNTLPLYDFDVTEIPEFDSRRLSFAKLRKSSTWLRYLRLEIYEESRLDYSGHSHFEVLPPTKYAPLHEDWYYWQPGHSYDDANARLYGQLCLTNEEMTEEFIRVLVEDFKANPQTNFVHLGQQDSDKMCDCDNCDAAKEKYNTNNAGLMVMFTNKVARGVTEIIQQSEPDRVIQFEMFAYLDTKEPPVKQVDGTYVPDCDEVIPDDNVVVQFAPLGSNVSETIDSVANQVFYDYLQGWKSLTDNISTWTYNTNFRWLVINHKNWDTALHDLRVYSKEGVKRVYNQSSNNIVSAGLFELRSYVESNLMWNISLDYQTLAKEFINGYYGVAAPYIQQMFEAMTTYYEYLHTEKSLTGDHAITLDGSKYWSFGYVESIRQIMEKAFAAIEPLKESDPGLYDKYYWRVAGAYLENLYMQMHYYRTNYGKDYSLAAIDLFEKICNKLGLVYMDENTEKSLSSYISQWRGTYA